MPTLQGAQLPSVYSMTKDGSSAYDESNALIWDFSIASGAFFDSLQSYNTGNGITLVPTDTLGIRSGTGNALTFSVYGVLSGVR